MVASFNGCLVSYQFYHQHSPLLFKSGLRKEQDASLVMNRTRRQAFRLLANVPSAKGNSKGEVIMVDPLEAKRLADKQMQQIQAKEKFKRRRQIEAINGAWAVIGLAAGLVIEGLTGKSIPNQLADYWSTIINLFVW